MEADWGTGISYFFCLNPLLARSSNFSGSSVFIYELHKLCEICVFGKIRKIHELWEPSGSTIAAWGLVENRSFIGEKIVLYVVCFAYSLVLVLVFILCFY